MWNPYYSFSLLTFCHHCFPFMTTRRSLMAKAAFLATSKELTSDTSDDETICFGFTGDIMLGRGIDAILPYHVDGVLHESYMRNAKGYVELAIKENGPLSQDEINERGFNYIWGDLVETFESVPNMMVVNLETSLTTSDDYAKDKGINYRAHPLNARSLQVFGSDSIVTLANNHVLDWGESGLLETLQTLDDAHIKYSGAGRNLDEAITPATSLVKNKNVAVVAVGLSSAGVPMHWKADTNKSGVYVMDNESVKNAVEIMKTFNESISDEAIKIVSIHMGPNWNPRIPENWRKFAHTLIDHGADIVIAHSSHHVKGIEVYRNKMISYGLGDFLNDYEGKWHPSNS